MARPLLFCNVGWMERYRGLTRNDKIIGGGQYVTINKRGFEICNFADVNGHMFGYVQAPRDHIRLERLGAAKEDTKLTGVDVVFTARRPGIKGKSVIVGWYRNATIYRKPEQVPSSAALHRRNGVMWHRLSARKTESHLLLPDERTLRVPRGRDGMGNSNVWYAEHAPREWLSRVRHLIEGGIVHVKSSHRTARSSDPERNARVELAAVKVVTAHYEERGYLVRSVERENRGWDLEATKDDVVLYIEVKGLSGAGNVVELTPNEYRAFCSSQKFDYRLCVVRSALNRPSLHVFRFAKANDVWCSESGTLALNVQPREAAVLLLRNRAS